MNLDLTITISVILGVAAIISPICVAIINNHYQLKLKQFESFELSQRKVLETFSQKSGEHFAKNNGYSTSDFLSSLYSLLPYFKISDKEIKSIISSTAKNDFENLNNKVNELIIELSKQIKPKSKLSLKHRFHK